MTKVALLTTFMNLPAQYGLVPTVLNQLKMLTKFHDDLPIGLFIVEGYENHVDWKRLPEGVKLEPLVPFLHLYDYQLGTRKQSHDVPAMGVGRPGYNKNLTNFDKQVKRLVHMLSDELARYDIIITHDIIFQTWFLVHNAAIRKIAELHPELRWIHWMHSGPMRWDERDIRGVHKLRFSGMKNSIWVSPNKTMTAGFAFMYDIPQKLVKVVYHAFDPIKFFDMHPWSRQLIEKHDLLDCDVLAVWPTRIDHPEGKGMFLALNLMAKLNKLGDCKILFLNSWSNSPKAKANIKRMREYAGKKRLPQEHLIFSSEMGREWEKGVPPKVVRDMYLIGNMFIFPSTSETFSYALAEAAATKNMLVLNENLEVMRELAEHRADYLAAAAEWGGKRIDVTYDAGEDGYCMGRAEELWQTLQSYKPLMQHRHVLRTFRDKWIWSNQLRPLIEEEW